MTSVKHEISYDGGWTFEPVNNIGDKITVDGRQFQLKFTLQKKAEVKE